MSTFCGWYRIISLIYKITRFVLSYSTKLLILHWE